MVAPDRKPPPQRGRLRIETDRDGSVLRWTGWPDGVDEPEVWQIVGRPLRPTHVHTWEMSMEAYVLVRDVLRFLTEADWKPGTVM